MKKIIILLIFIVNSFSFAQGFYEIKLNGSILETRNAYCSELRIRAILDNGQEVILYDQGYPEDRRININITKKISNMRTIRRFTIYAKRHFNDRCKQRSKEDRIGVINVPYPYTCFRTTPSNYGSNIVGNAIGDFSVNFEIKPLINIESPGINDFLPADHKIDINATSGFPNLTSTYTWQYKLQGTTTFIDMPLTFNNRAGLSISAKDIFGTNINNQFGKQIQFRVISCNERYSSLIRTYTIVPSAPTFVAEKASSPSCYGNTDGSVRFTFSRPLYPNEKLSILPKDGSTPFPSTPDLTELQVNPDTGIKDSYTIQNIAPGTYTATVLGFYGLFNTYSIDEEHDQLFEVVNPIVVKIDSVDVTPNWCNDGDGNETTNNDSTIRITASGGNEGTYQYNITNSMNISSGWINFNSGNEHLLNNVIPNTYKIQMRKSVWNGTVFCPAYTLNDAGEPLSDLETITVEVEQPDEPLKVTVERINQPTAFGFKDGRVRATVSGGSRIDENRYDFQWADGDNNVIDTFTTDFDSIQNTYVTTLYNIGTGLYTITAWDKNYPMAINKIGCTVKSESLSLTEPPALKVTIEIKNGISCNNGNEYFDFEDQNMDNVVDQFQDGALIAYAKGGVPFNVKKPNYTADRPINGDQEPLPYYYHWKKQLADNSWEEIGQKDSIITFLSTATYALNIKDSLGIELGTYSIEPGADDGSNTYVIVQKTDSIQFLSQPDKLRILFDTTKTSCAEGNDASATVTVTGGAPPYTYKWNNEVTTGKNENLTAGIYFVSVQDAKGCRTEGSVTIEQPNGIAIDPIQIQNPTCFEGNDGIVELEVSGGSPPYSFQWDQGGTTNKLTGMKSGAYTFEVKDMEGCTAIYEANLIDPDPIIVDLGGNRTLCAQQSLLLDIGIEDKGASYSWSSDNGFISMDSSVALFESGVYTATVTTARGCTGSTTVSVEVKDTPIDADFLITTQAYVNEEVLLVNVSEPLGDKVDWTIPEGVGVISKTDEELLLSFGATGPYDIHLRSHQGDCYLDYTKTILVQPAPEVSGVDTTSGSFIEEFLVYPNPNNGTFKVKVSLADVSNIDVKIVNLISAETIAARNEKNRQEFLMDYTVHLPSGIYLLWLETPKGSETRKLVVE